MPKPLTPILVAVLVIGSLQSQSGLTLFSLPDRRVQPLLQHAGLYLFVLSARSAATCG